MALTIADVYGQFPEFDLTDYTGITPVANGPQDTLVTRMLASAETQTDRTLCATTALADQVVLYLTAHLLARSIASMNARLQKTRGDDKLKTGEDVYWPVYERLARSATSGFRNT